MNTYVTIGEIKKHLNIETEFTEDDEHLLQLISVAEMVVYDYCNGGLSGSTTTIIIDGETVTALPKSVKQAILLFAAHLYVTRTMVSFAQGYEIPFAFKFLLNPHRNFSIC